MRQEIHIVPNQERGGWDAKRQSADRASKHFETKADALDYGMDGKIQNPNSYGNDPCPPRDTKH